MNNNEHKTINTTINHYINKEVPINKINHEQCL